VPSNGLLSRSKRKVNCCGEKCSSVQRTAARLAVNNAT
jgi:hypothetical protein